MSLNYQIKYKFKGNPQLFLTEEELFALTFYQILTGMKDIDEDNMSEFEYRYQVYQTVNRINKLTIFDAIPDKINNIESCKTNAPYLTVSEFFKRVRKDFERELDGMNFNRMSFQKLRKMKRN